MKKKLFFNLVAITFLLLTAACAEEDFGIAQPESPQNSESQSANILAISEYIKSHHKSTRGGIDLLPYVVYGDTIFYVANYPEGGFEIFTNDQSLPMVFAKSKEGSFNPYIKFVKDPFNEYFENTAKTIADTKDSEVTLFDEVDSQWKKHSTRSDSDDRDHGEGGDGEPIYVGDAYEATKSIYTPKDGRLTTKWGQRNNFNQYVPYCTDAMDIHAPVGCAPVAVGQYLFFTHKHYGVPQSTVINATYNSSSNTYTYTGSSSTIWNQMVEGTDISILSSPSKMKATAVFLGFLGKEMDTKYAYCGHPDNPHGSTGSGTYRRYELQAINKYFNKSYTINPFDFEKTISILRSGLPVYTVSDIIVKNDGVSSDSGHAFIIDYAEELYVYCYEVYADSDEINPDLEYPDDNEYGEYGNPISFYQEAYGHIYIEPSYTDNQQWIAMNWGWYGTYDDILINAKVSKWILDRASDRLELYQNYIFY